MLGAFLYVLLLDFGPLGSSLSVNEQKEISNTTALSISDLSYHVTHTATPLGTGKSPTGRQAGSITKPPNPFGTGVCWYAGMGLPNIGCDESNVWTTIDRLAVLSTSLLPEECVLWNKTCGGDRTYAAEQFFNTTRYQLFLNSCFLDNESDVCRNLETEERLAEFQMMKDWMRTQECWSDLLEYDRRHNITPEDVTHKDFCCDTCHMGVENVDVYYWPDPNADTSCLSIVGDTINPPAHGGTTIQIGEVIGVHWECMAATGSSYITTATITTMGSLSMKQTLIDPWGPALCITASTASARPRSSPGLNATLQARAHTLVIPRTLANVSVLPSSTLVTDGFTL